MLKIPPVLAIPDLSVAAFIAPNATVVGDVKLAIASSIWYGAIVRGDVERIEIGAYSNVQDGAVMHGDPGTITILEDYVTVGHRAIIHAAQIERGALIGMGAIILDGVRIGAGSIIAAGSVVTKNVPPRSLVKGLPGKVVSEVSAEKVEALIEHAKQYAQLALVHAGKGQEPRFTRE